MEQSTQRTLNRKKADAAAFFADRLPDGNRHRWRGDNHHAMTG